MQADEKEIQNLQREVAQAESKLANQEGWDRRGLECLATFPKWGVANLAIWNSTYNRLAKFWT